MYVSVLTCKAGSGGVQDSLLLSELPASDCEWERKRGVEVEVEGERASFCVQQTGTPTAAWHGTA